MLLPMLHSSPAAMAAKRFAKPDKKLVIMYIPNGIVRRQFFPGEGESELPGFIGGFNADKTKEQRRKTYLHRFYTAYIKPLTNSFSIGFLVVTRHHEVRFT